MHLRVAAGAIPVGRKSKIMKAGSDGAKRPTAIARRWYVGMAFQA